jgi:hypothetical protein
MTRRRFILAACVAVVALGAAWWMFVGGLTAEEQRLVGLWQQRHNETGRITGALDLKADHSFLLATTDNKGQLLFTNVGAWSVKAGKLSLDTDPDPIRRLLRRIFDRFGMEVRGNIAELVTSDFVADQRPVNNFSWTRNRGD